MIAGGIAQQPHRLFTHGIDRINRCRIIGQLIANDAALLLFDRLVQTRSQSGNFVVNFLLRLSVILDNIQALHLLAGHISNQIFDLMPDDIGTCQVQHLTVDGFHRSGCRCDQERRVT